MKKVSTDLLAKLQAGELVCFTIIDMCLDGTWHRFTDCDVPLVVDGHTYNPATVQAGDVDNSADTMIAAFSMKIATETTGLKTAFVNGTPRGGQLVARLVFLNPDYYSAYAVNKLTDGGFETGALGSWSLDVESCCDASAAVTDTTPYKGTYCAKITIADGAGNHVRDICFQQQLSEAVSAGTLYDLTFAAKATAARKIAADIGPVAGSDYPMFYNVDLTTEWQYFTLPFIAGEDIGAGDAYVNFYLARDDSNDDVYIDQVRFSNSLYPIMVFKGYLDSWKLDEEWIDVQIVSALEAWNRRIIRKSSSTCRWLKFKGEECGYSGEETWCDRTYARCSALGNTANYGGFRWLPSIMNKKIFWGRSPYSAPVSGCIGGGGGYI